MAMTLAPAVLENRFLRLEPMSEAHREDFRAACNSDETTWKTLYPFSWAGDQFEPSWARLQADIAAGRFWPFAVMADGKAAGISGYLTPDLEQETVEIGGTWYRPDLRGGPVNPAAKRLLLGHAFEAGARRVQFKVDAINARSRAAVLKLGATQEGILRQDRITWTGRIRDTAYFSILRDEWPVVRERLDARLASFAAEAAH